MIACLLLTDGTFSLDLSISYVLEKSYASLDQQLFIEPCIIAYAYAFDLHLD